MYVEVTKWCEAITLVSCCSVVLLENNPRALDEMPHIHVLNVLFSNERRPCVGLKMYSGFIRNFIDIEFGGYFHISVPACCCHYLCLHCSQFTSLSPSCYSFFLLFFCKSCESLQLHSEPRKFEGPIVQEMESASCVSSGTAPANVS